MPFFAIGFKFQFIGLIINFQFSKRLAFIFLNFGILMAKSYIYHKIPC